MIWLASYPRSGNTYLRNILFELYGFESADYHFNTRRSAEDYTKFPFVKTHLLPWQLVPRKSSVPAIYIVRDGRDALVSMAHQRKDILEPGADFRKSLFEAIVAEKGSYFGGWSNNVKQWLDRANLVIRYEDLVNDPVKQMERVRRMLDLPPADYSKLPTFEKLKFGVPKYGNGNDQETDNAQLKAEYSKKFFRKGKAGAWKDDMDSGLHDLFWSYHGDVMEQMGYRYDGSMAELHNDVDRKVRYKLDLAPDEKENATPRKILVEATRLLMHFNDGTKRYLVELLKEMEEVAEAPASKWEIDLYIGGKIYPISACRKLIHTDDVHEQYLLDYQIQRFGATGNMLYNLKKDMSNKRSLPAVAWATFKKVVKAVRDSAPVMHLRKLITDWRKYPFTFKFNSVWFRGMRKLGLLPRITDLTNYDLIHLPLMQNYFAFRNIKGNYMVTMHDLTHIYFPQFHTVENVQCCEEAMSFIARNNAEIIAISESTRQDYINETGVDPSKVHVIYEAADRKKFRLHFNQHEITQAKRTYHIPDEPYFLCLSTIEPRKNLINTVKAFSLFLDEHPDAKVNLVIAGKKGWKHDELFSMEIGHKDRIIYTGFVADGDLAKLYSGALALSYVSFYEGFGLPPLEAMSCQTPVIYGNNSSMIEVVGDSGCKADPYDASDIKKQFELLYYNPDLRTQKAHLSLQQSFKFTWRQTILQTLDVYTKVINRKSGTKVESRREEFQPSFH